MRKTPYLYGMYVLLLAIFMAGCNPPTTISYTIVAPTNGSMLTAVPASFVIRYDTKPTAADIRLNGVSVRRFFTFGATEASAAGVDLQGYLVQGTNTFSVDKAGGGPAITFTLDTEGPTVSVLSVSTTEPKEITGIASDVSGVTGVTLNGVSVNVNVDGTFAANVSTADQYVFVATDTRSHQSTIRIVPEGRQFNPIIKAAVNETTVQSLGPVIAAQIRDADLKPVLQALNPVFEQTVQGPILGATYGMRVDIDDGTLGSVTLNSFDILPVDNAGLAVDADIYDVAAHMDMTVLNGILPSYHILGWFYVDHVHFTGTIKLGVENGELKITFPDMDLEMDGVVTDFDNVPDFLEHLISPLTEVLVDVFKDQISVLAKAAIESLLEEKINEMIIATNVRIDPVAAVEGDEIELGLDTRLESIGTHNRNLLVGLSGGMYAITRDEGVPPALGSIYDTGSVPDAALDQGNVTAVVSANLINQAMMVAYQVGLTHFWIQSGQLHFGSQPDDSVGTTGATRIRFAPTSPALFKISGNDTIVSTLGLNSFDVVLDKKLSTGWAPQFLLNMDTLLNIELAVNSTNRLTIGLVGTPNFHVNYVENYTALPLNEAQLTQTINTVLPKLVPLLGNAVGAIEIPSFGGIRLLPVRMSAVGPNHQHLSFSGNLSVTP